MATTNEKELQNIPRPLILFDGVCNLCNASVQFIIENDAHACFAFASLQSSTGQKILAAFNRPLEMYDSVLLFDKGELHTHSTAACLIAQGLSTRWRFLGGLIWLPKAFRDFGYRMIAKNRYHIWGKQTQCWLPTPELSKRFF